MEAQKCEYGNLEVTPGHLEFTAKEGTRFISASQRLYIKKAAGGGTLPTAWKIAFITATTGFLDVRPMSGSGKTTLYVQIDARGLPAGKREAKIRITPKAEGVTITPSEIPVTLTIQPKPPPPPPTRIPCPYCKLDFDTEESLRDHVEQAHPPPPPETYKCRYCGLMFDTEERLQRHIKEGHTLRQLTVSSVGRGVVTTPGEDTFTYEDQMIVRLVAEAEEGSRFVNWTGDRSTIADVNASTTWISMKGDYTTIANFEEIPPPNDNVLRQLWELIKRFLKWWP